MKGLLLALFCCNIAAGLKSVQGGCNPSGGVNIFAQTVEEQSARDEQDHLICSRNDSDVYNFHRDIGLKGGEN